MSNKKILNCTNNYLKEYKQNQMQIDCIKKTLIKHSDVPEKLIDWLIESVKKNTIIEFKNKKV